MSVLIDEYRTTREGLRYGFAVGKVRVLETRLLDRSALERLVDASSFAEQKRILSEGPYGRFLEGVDTPAQVETAIDAALGSAYAFLDEAGLPPAVVRFFRLRFDYANLKAALKAGSVGASLEGLLTAHGTVEPDAFSAPLDRLPGELGPLAASLSRSAGDDEDAISLMALDAAVDRAMFRALGEEAEAAKSPFLRLVARLLVDLANVKTVVRAMAAAIPPHRIESELLLDGGTVALPELARIVRLPARDALTALERRYRLAGSPLSGDDAPDLDVIVDNALVAAVRRGRRPEPGAEDVIAYVLAREAEAQVLRVALLGKMAGLDSAALHRRMRASFR